MSVINELLRAEADGSLSFGNYELESKTKLDGFEHQGDIYKVKTFKDITRLEKNDTFLFESVPGTAVSNLIYNPEGVCFRIEGPEDTQVTLDLTEDAEYAIYIGEDEIGRIKTNLGGKLSFSIGLEERGEARVRIIRI